MTPNKLTPEEKQMPVIRLPLRIAVFAWIGIFLGIVGTSAAAAMGEKLFIAIFGGILLFSLGWQGIYLRHCLFFNKNEFIFRNKFGKIQHYVYEDITYIDENRDSLLLNIRGCKIRIDKNTKTAKEFLTTALDKNTEKKCYGISGKESTALNVDPQFILLSIIIQASFIFFFLLIPQDLPSGPLEIYLKQRQFQGPLGNYLTYFGYGIFIFGILYAYWLILIYFRYRIVYNETEIITFDIWGRKEYFRFSDVTAAEETYTDENGVSSTPSVFYFGDRKLKFSYYLKTTEVQEAETQERLARIANEKASSKESPKNTIPQNEEKTDESEDYFFAFQVFAVLIFIIFITSWFLMRNALQEQYLFIATLLLSAAGVTALIDILFLTIRKFPYRFPLFLLKPYIRWINPSAEFFEELSPKQKDKAQCYANKTKKGLFDGNNEGSGYIIVLGAALLFGIIGVLDTPFYETEIYPEKAVTQEIQVIDHREIDLGGKGPAHRQVQMLSAENEFYHFESNHYPKSDINKLFDAIDNNLSLTVLYYPQSEEVYAITDENGVCHLSVEEYLEMDRKEMMKYFRFFYVFLFFLFIAVFYPPFVCHINRMPRPLIRFFLFCDIPTEKMIREIPDEYKKEKQIAIKRREHYLKKEEKDKQIEERNKRREQQNKERQEAAIQRKKDKARWK